MKFLKKVLFTETSSYSLIYLRVIMGFAYIYILQYFHSYFINDLLLSKYFVTYDFFHWVTPLPIFWFNILFYSLYISAIGMALGFKYRMNAIICFLGFTYIFLIDKGHYNNHYYLYSILLFFFTIVDANKTFSIDAWLKSKENKTKIKDTSIPSWQIWIFRIQFFIVYFYGGLAKLHLDWFKGFPMRFWLYDKSYEYPQIIGNFLRSETGALFFSYGGLAFDLSIGFLLLSKRFKRIALIPLIIFHVSNHFLWNIGSFPWIMILFTPIFFSDTLPKDVYDFIKRNKWRSFLIIRKTSLKKIFFFFLPKKKIRDSTSEIKLYTYKKNPLFKMQIVTFFFVIWFLFQTLFPLRHFYFKGSPSWTGQGQLFAWRMMLVDTLAAINIEFNILDTGEKFNVGFEHYLNFKQFKHLNRTPMTIIKFSNYLSQEFKKNNPSIDFQVSVEIWKSVNERIPQLLTDTSINYANYPYEPWKSQTCFTKWSETDVEPTFSLEKYDNWKKVIELSGEE